MIYGVLLVIAALTWLAVHLVPARNGLMRAGIAMTVVGALTTSVMWWMVFPEIVLVAGLVTLAIGWSRPAVRPG